MVKAIVGFLIGVVLTALTAFLIVYPNSRTQNEKLLSDQQHTTDLSNQVRNLQAQIQSLTTDRDTSLRGLQSQIQSLTTDKDASIQNLQAQIQSLTTDRDACKSKFERATILYDVGVLGGQTRAWVVPVDVEPRIVGGKRGTYSHYDPKSQTETVHFNATSR
jgi:outer membrane murein-binding lipoprotein Lpp